MPSSISDSDGGSNYLTPDRFTVVLLGTILVILISLEVLCRDRFDQASSVQQREVTGRQSLLAVRDAGTSKDPHIVIVGNSLMLHGIDVTLLKTNLDSRFVPVPYFVLGTNYYDWYFGLKRLFAEGMRPEYVLLGLSPNQLATSETRGDISARYMVQQSDLLDFVRETHMDATTASDFILAHYSEYYSTREITRGYVMSRALPAVEELLHSRYATYRDPAIDEPVLRQLASNRLEALNQLCRANGAHFLFVVPPSYQEGGDTILRTGMERGITVLLPVGDNEFDAGNYEEDGIHMNEKGARIFTERLAVDLNKELLK
jgi:hypothetical protein